MITVPYSDPLAKEYWASWLVLQSTDEELIKRWVLNLVSDLELAAAERDYKRMQAIWGVATYAEQFCQDEPLATAYDLGLMLNSLTLAGILNFEERFAAAADIVAAVWATLEAGDRRRKAAGCEFRHNSEVRYLALQELSIAKALGPGLLREFHFSLDEMHAELQAVADRVVWFLNNYSEDLERNRKVMQNLAFSELEMAKVLYRFQSPLLHPALQGFAERHCVELSADPWHYRRGKAIESAYYWDFERYKVFRARHGTAEDLDYCTALMMEHASEVLLPVSFRSLFERWTREATLMKQKQLAQLEVQET